MTSPKFREANVKVFCVGNSKRQFCSNWNSKTLDESRFLFEAVGDLLNHFYFSINHTGASPFFDPILFHMVFKHGQPSSDYDPDFLPPPKRLKRALSLPPSSPPQPATPEYENPLTPEVGALTPTSNGEMEDFDDLRPLPPLFEISTSSTTDLGPDSSPETPHRPTQRGGSLEPQPSSPMSIVDVTPLKPKTRRGRPAHSPETRRLTRTVRKLGPNEDTPEKRKHDKVKAELAKRTALGAVAVAPRMGSPVGSRAASFTNSAYSGRKSSVPHSHIQCSSSITRQMMFPVNGMAFKTCSWNSGLRAISGPKSPTRNWF